MVEVIANLFHKGYLYLWVSLFFIIWSVLFSFFIMKKLNKIIHLLSK